MSSSSSSNLVPKLILCGALIANGYFIIFDPAIKQTFKKNFEGLQGMYPWMEHWTNDWPFDVAEVSRLAVALINIFSFFMLLDSTGFFTYIVVLSLVYFAAVFCNPYLAKNAYQKQLAYLGLLKNLGIIGGLISFCHHPAQESVKGEEKEEATLEQVTEKEE